MKPIALITDFGLDDHFVGSMKAAILDVNPRAVIIDVSHSIPPGDIMAAASTLLFCFRDFPKSSIFVVMVDPGVGSDRKSIIIKAGSYYFVGPDNGVLSLAGERIGPSRVIRRIENDGFFRKPVSSTFHGRDIFGPVAAHLSRGVAFEKFGPLEDSFISMGFPPVTANSRRIIGSVIAVDRFGNCITSIEPSHLEKLLGKKLSIAIKGKSGIPVRSSYADVPEGKPLGLIGCAGFLEISINGASAAEKLKIMRGDRVELS
jgi:S-adenosyl-L-methionine hydrolase (adenosine-forming)